MVKNNLKIFWLAAVVAAMVGCDSNEYFEEYQELDKNGWASNKQLAFAIDAKDTQIEHNLFVMIRNTKKYKYQNLYLFLDVMAPSGKLERDTIECLLADAGGKWYGDHSGNIVESKVWFKTDYKFAELGQYQFLFEQAMREDKLEEVIDLGFRVEYK